MRLTMEVNKQELERMIALADKLGTSKRKATGRVGRLPFTYLVRDLLMIGEAVMEGYPAIAKQAIQDD